MTIKDVLDYFGSWYKCHLQTGVHYSTFKDWKKKGCISMQSQQKIEYETKGALKFDINHTRPGDADKE